jgi:NAD+ synthase (glutamine-hydrolysing)
MRLALAQINPTVGDLNGNTSLVLEYMERARQCGADVVAFPEMCLTGYPPEDLLFKPRFIARNRDAMERVVAQSQDLTIIVGFVDSDSDHTYNAAAIAHHGKLAGIYRKAYLPNYGVFDEERYFNTGTENPVFFLNGIGIGINICEDIWYPVGPGLAQSMGGAEIIIVINASPFNAGKLRFREQLVCTRAADYEAFVAYLNTVGGQDELVFDGGSLLSDPAGNLIARAGQFQEELLMVDIDADDVFQVSLHDSSSRQERSRGASLPEVTRVHLGGEPFTQPKPPLIPEMAPPLAHTAEVYRALIMGTGDYVRKNGFHKVVIGLSGGIDSSLVATIATDALGRDSVIGVTMPSRYTSEASQSDAQALAQNLGIEVIQVPIEEPFSGFLSALEGPFSGTQPGVAEENLQSRSRANILLSLSNKFGWLVLTTGNKSELATGYATLAGDLSGGFAVIRDVPKTLAFELARYRNQSAGEDIIPESVLTKPPSAELRPDQKDSDSLPPYEVLDPILKAYVEEDKSLAEIVAMGYDEATVNQVMRMVDRNEYKRRQGPVGIKITPRAFGRDRRMPIVNLYRDS